MLRATLKAIAARIPDEETTPLAIVLSVLLALTIYVGSVLYLKLSPKVVLDLDFEGMASHNVKTDRTGRSVRLFGDVKPVSNMAGEGSSSAGFHGAGGRIEIAFDDGFPCITASCAIHMKVRFAQPPPHGSVFLMGQWSKAGPNWHLIFHEGQLILQIDGGAEQMQGKWLPQQGRWDELTIRKEGPQISMVVNGVVVAQDRRKPFVRNLDRGRALRIGSRGAPDGSGPAPFIGDMDDIRISRL